MTNRKRTLALIFIPPQTEQRSEAVDEFATSYPLAIGWMVGNSESRTSTGKRTHIHK